MKQDEAYKLQVERLKRRVAELERQLRTDDLTNVLSRRGLLQSLQAYVSEVDFQLKHPDRRKFVAIRSLSLLFIDVDNFKKINDKYGHAAGDEVLSAVAATIRTSLRGIDVVGRYGGEEILVGLVGADLDRASRIANTLRENIEQIRLPDISEELRVTASFGVSELSEGLSLKELISQADEALFTAKAAGRNRVEVFSSGS